MQQPAHLGTHGSHGHGPVYNIEYGMLHTSGEAQGRPIRAHLLPHEALGCWSRGCRSRRLRGADTERARKPLRLGGLHEQVCGSYQVATGVRRS